jgi:hypothetical protein
MIWKLSSYVLDKVLKCLNLQNTTCLCIRDIVQVEGVSTSRCDWNCSYDDDSHVNDCGGSDTYNVYKVTPRDDRFKSGNLPNNHTISVIISSPKATFQRSRIDLIDPCIFLFFSIKERTVNCVVLGCYEQYSQIHTDNCTEDLGRVCQSEGGYGYRTGW